ncbi:hypothetical protein Mgra_00003737 [Meloidogyne graminicola]|uniref:Uncharacterized protein n=1 Tax=Meloidogyne graminicola TaxID=189291 RepID=A0A8S9ZUX3_9BILA|nr:hypothetical protein Mgra_00003737 [Meloidogyne graminicola]
MCYGDSIFFKFQLKNLIKKNEIFIINLIFLLIIGIQLIFTTNLINGEKNKLNKNNLLNNELIDYADNPQRNPPIHNK